MWVRRAGLIAVVAAVAVHLSGGAAPTEVSAQTSSVRGVSILGRSLFPRTYRVPAESEIRFMNGDRVAHSLRTVGRAPQAFEIDLPARPDDRTPCIDSQTGDTYCPTATTAGLAPGRYDYACTIHKRMVGTLLVAEPRRTNVPSPRPSPTRTPSTPQQVRRAVSILGTNISPRNMVVRQGAELTFVNGSTEPHWFRTINMSRPEDETGPPLEFDTGEIEARSGPANEPGGFPRSAPIEIAANTRPGRYTYACEIHPQMNGTVRVLLVDPAA